ncbi:MAG: hypothetical protein WB408_20555, partial [Terracidiphilus sp.]
GTAYRGPQRQVFVAGGDLSRADKVSRTSPGFTAVSELVYTESTLQSGIFIKKMPPFNALKKST